MLSRMARLVFGMVRRRGDYAAWCHDLDVIGGTCGATPTSPCRFRVGSTLKRASR